jgi:hypothetical protein
VCLPAAPALGRNPQQIFTPFIGYKFWVVTALTASTLCSSKLIN